MRQNHFLGYTQINVEITHYYLKIKGFLITNNYPNFLSLLFEEVRDGSYLVLHH